MQNQQPSTLKEIRVHGTQNFPCAFYQTGTRIKGNMVKHHWHEEVEPDRDQSLKRTAICEEVINDQNIVIRIQEFL